MTISVIYPPKNKEKMTNEFEQGIKDGDNFLPLSY
jgi:hypothetical protein